MSRTQKPASTHHKHATSPAGIPIDLTAQAAAREKRTTQPVPTGAAPPPAPGTTKTHRRPIIEQPLDPPEYVGSTILADIRARWAAGGSILPQPAESHKLLTAYKAARDQVAVIREQLQKALDVEAKTVLDLARAFGGNSLRIDGVVHDFASRGDLVFFRRKNVGIIDT